MAKKIAKKASKAKAVKTAKVAGPSSGLRAERGDKMLKLLKKKCSAQDLAEGLDCSISAVYYRLRSLGDKVKAEFAPKIAGKRGPRSILYSL